MSEEIKETTNKKVYILVFDIENTNYKVYKVVVTENEINKENADNTCDCKKKNFSTDAGKIFYIAHQEQNKSKSKEIQIIFTGKFAHFINNDKKTEKKENA